MDYVKIHESFVRNMDEDALNPALVAPMIGMAHAVGKKPVAEFVQTESVLNVLRKMGVDRVQGHDLSART